MPQSIGPLVGAFSGENRRDRDTLIPDNISPDAENCDYNLGTLRRRLPYARLHNEYVLSGGVHIENDGTNKCIQIPDHSNLSLSGDWTIELSVKFEDVDPTNNHILAKIDTASTLGWLLFVASNGKLRFRIYDSTSATYDTTSTTVLEKDTVYRIRITHTSSTNTVAMELNGVEEASAASANALTGGNSSFPLFIGAHSGATPGTTTCSFTIDELRIWGAVKTDDTLSYELVTNISDDLDAYYRFNESTWNIVEDFRRGTGGIPDDRMHGSFYNTGPSYVDSILQYEQEEGTAIRFDGIDDEAWAPYVDDYDPILDTGTTWTIECVFRLDTTAYSGSGTLFHIGDHLAGNGTVIEAYIDSSQSLYITYSTATTHNNATHDTGETVARGTSCHLAITRDGDDIKTYIDGVLVDTLTGVTSEIGPITGPSTSDGYIGIGHRKNSSANDRFLPVTVDELRVWSSARSANQIAKWVDIQYKDAQDSNLVGYWRFDTGDVERDETTHSDLSTNPNNDDALAWSYGLCYPVPQTEVFDERDQSRILMVAQTTSDLGLDEALTDNQPTSRELLMATHTGLWSLQGTEIRHLMRLTNPGGTALYSHAHFQERVIFCNGLEPNRKYDGTDLPATLTLAAPTTAPGGSTSGTSGSFPETGDFDYRYSFINLLDGTESLVGDVLTINVSPANKQVDLTGIEVSDNTQVTHTRLYREDPSSTVYRYLADVPAGTTTYTDLGGDISANDALDLNRGNPAACKYTTVYGGRVWLCNEAANPSRVYYSEANKLQFPILNFIDIDPGDGDEITGAYPVAGGLAIFKRNRIMYLTGKSSFTFQVRELVDGTGCVSGATIAEAHTGLYFLSGDGVYRLTGNGVEPIAESQDELFDIAGSGKGFMPDRHKESVATYDDNTHRYILSMFNNADISGSNATETEYSRITMIFDENTNSWSKSTVGFDALESLVRVDDLTPVSYPNKISAFGAVGTRNGYVNLINHKNSLASDFDGAYVISKAFEYTDDLTASFTDEKYSITNSGAAFPTEGNGLAGVPIYVTTDSGATVTQRTIVYNTATILYLDGPLTDLDSISGTYYIGLIPWHWESRWMDMGNGAVVKQWYETILWLQEGTETVTLKWKTDQYETWQSGTFSTADEFARVATEAGGRKLKLRFEYLLLTGRPEIESFQTVHAGGNLNG